MPNEAHRSCSREQLSWGFGSAAIVVGKGEARVGNSSVRLWPHSSLSS